MTEVWTLGVEELVAAIGAGSLGAVEVVEAFASRADGIDAIVHCFITRDGDAPRRAAARERAGGRGPLHGVPYAYKDVFAHRGVRPTVGARDVRIPLRAHRSTVLDRLDRAGAISLGALNLDPFAYAATGINRDFGDVRNPWDPSRIAGGSSGGAAAAVAAGAVPFAIGSDSGGSIRIPAALCGVTGLKPTLGRIPKTGVAPVSYSQDTVGILARSARDVALVLEHMAGHDPMDGASIPAPVPAFTDLGGSCEGAKIGFDRRRFADQTTPEIAEAAESALAVLEGLGADLVDVDLSELDDLDTAATVLTWAEVTAVHERTFGAEPAKYAPAIRARLELALGAHGADHVNAMRLQGRALAGLLDGVLAVADMLIVPTIAGPAVTIDSLEGDAVDVSISHLRLNRPFSFTGLPALAVPAGFSAEGLPLGVQLVTRPWGEPMLLASAAAFQAATDWHRRLPSLPAAGHDREADRGSTRLGPLV